MCGKSSNNSRAKSQPNGEVRDSGVSRLADTPCDEWRYQDS